MSRVRSSRKGEKNMSGAGAVGGVGGAGGIHPGGSIAGAQTVTPSKGASGVTDDGGKEGLNVGGSNNLVGNTQTQNVNITNETNNTFNMSSENFMQLHNMGSCSSMQGSQEIAPMGGTQEASSDMQKLIELMIMMMIMKMMSEMMQQ